jgi:catechol 2,3-dioxygenase-like lactoylglutathione lyase family enzyme
MPTDRENPRWRGLHHLALVTTDMDATTRFYHGVLGAPLVATVDTGDFKHYFFDFGPGSTVAFFEYKNMEMESYAKPAGMPFPRAAQFDHLSMALPDEEALLALRERLKAADCEVTDVIDHGFLRSVYFSDPNGIALEATYWTLDATGRPADYGDRRLFADEDPVPAVTELQRDGRLSHLPATQLVDEVKDLYRPGAD